MLFGNAIEEGIRRGLDASMGDVIDKIILRTLDYVRPHIEQLMRENAALRQEISELKRRRAPATAPASAEQRPLEADAREDKGK